MEPATVVIDNGTGYSKMGYAGNMEPSYMMPSVIALNVQKVSNYSYLQPIENGLVCVEELLQPGDGLLHRRRGALSQPDPRDPLYPEKRVDFGLGRHREILAQVYLLLPSLRARAA